MEDIFDGCMCWVRPIREAHLSLGSPSTHASSSIPAPAAIDRASERGRSATGSSGSPQNSLTKKSVRRTTARSPAATIVVDVMGFNPPVPQQDSDWEIRVAVLLSLVLQILLIFVGPVRKRSSHPLPRFTVWACYLLADWVADLALGLLLNNMGNIGSSGGGGGNNTTNSSSSSLKRGGGGGNSAATTTSSSSNPIIFALWTPFLLLHLGGPDTITAYSLEDNELWLRHLIGLLFELFSAAVIFFCSLRGNPMVHATALMFVAGIIKYAERTYSLYSGSVDGFRNKILDPPEPGPNYAKLMTEFDSKEKAGLRVEIAIADGEASKAHKEMELQETERLVLKVDKSVEARAYEFFLIFRRLFVNLILSFKERRRSQAFFLDKPDLTPAEAFDVIEVELNFIYDMVYTKAPVAHRKLGWALRGVCSGCLVSALLVFLLLDKRRHGIGGVDTAITYALLLGGLALDAVALLMLLFSNRVKVFLEEESPERLGWLARLTQAVKKRWRTRRWSGKTSQMNLIGYCLGKPGGRYSSRGRRRWWLSAADKMGLEEVVDDFIFIRRVALTGSKQGDDEEQPRLLKFIFDGLKKAAKKLEEKKKKQAEDEKEAAAAASTSTLGMEMKKEIMEVCNCRGERVVSEYKEKMTKSAPSPRPSLLGGGGGEAAESTAFSVIRDSVATREFDESLLLWHIATELCGRHPEEHAPMPEKAAWMKPIGETLSEYMLYLLIKQPEMLSATAGIGLLRYRDTCEEARRFFGSMEAWIGGDRHSARELLLSVNTSERPGKVKGDRSKSVLFDGVILAKALRELGDEELMWEVVAGVWGEMLTYAAGRCRGSTHVRQLSRGGELITLVWFLMAHMGLGDMYQIQEGDAKAKLIVKDH